MLLLIGSVTRPAVAMVSPTVLPGELGDLSNLKLMTHAPAQAGTWTLLAAQSRAFPMPCRHISHDHMLADAHASGVDHHPSAVKAADPAFS